MAQPTRPDPNRLRAALEDAGVSNAELADALGVSRGFVSHWLSGYRAIPAKYLNAIAETLRVDRGWLTGSHGAAGAVRESVVTYDQALRSTEDFEMSGSTRGDRPIDDADWSFRPAPRDGGRDYGSANVWTLPADLATLVRETGQNSLDHAVRRGGSVQMRYSLIELRKGVEPYERFVRAIHFDDLRTHIERASGTRSKLATRLRAGLKRFDQSDRLLLLRIDDFGTTGLYGAEASTGALDDNPFASLVRNNLDSSKRSTTAGGSFGLGKAVLWRCSDLSTVFFASHLAPEYRGEEESGLLRCIGKAELTWHPSGEGEQRDFAGPGWLGRRGSDGHSMWLDDRALEDLRLSRATDRLPPGVDSTHAHGTSLLILGFQDPAAEGEPDPGDLLEQLARATAENFWPLLIRDQLRVTIEHLVDGSVKELMRQVDPMDYVLELCELLVRHDDDEVEEELVLPGDVVRVAVPHRVPATSDESGELQPFPEDLEARGWLIVRLAEEKDSGSAQLNTVALVRGRGMVVKYWRRANIVVGARPFHAVLLAGLEAGSDAPELAADQFLRLAEPPAHDDWSWNPELKEKYAWGARTRLLELFEATTKALAEVLRPQAADDERVPRELQRLLQLSLPKPPDPPTAKYRGYPSAEIRNGCWRVEGEIHMNNRRERWAVVPRLRIDAESGRKIRIPWESLQILSCRGGAARVDDGTLIVEPRTRRIGFRGLSVSGVEGIRVAACRTKIDLQVKKVEGAES